MDINTYVHIDNIDFVENIFVLGSSHVLHFKEGK